jgi:type II secretory pathway component PulF
MLVALVIAVLFVCGVLAFFRPGLGFIASAALGIALVVSGLANEWIELVVAGPAVFLVALVAMGIFSRQQERGLWARTLARWILAACGLLLLVVVSFAFFGRGGSFGLMAVLMVVGAASDVIATSGLTTAAYVISTIASSARQNLPLPTAMEMAAAGQGDKRARILRDIKKWLVEGYSLSESLKRGYARCPGYAVALVAVGERIGQVPQALGALEQDLVAKVSLSRKVRHIPSFYPPIVLFVMFIVVLLLMTFVIPKYDEVLKEMVSGELPAATIVLLRIARFIAYDFGWLLGLLLILGFVIGGMVYVRIKARPRRPDKPYAISRIGDFIRWHLPLLRWYEWNRAMQRIAGMLRLSLNAGCTVNEAIANTLRLDINECFKTRLKEWLDRVERGDDISQSAQQCGLGSAMAWAFADMHNHRNTLDVLETLESSYRWGYSRAATLARFIIGTCETLCLGLMVGFIAYAFFSPLIAVIYATAESIVP